MPWAGTGTRNDFFRQSTWKPRALRPWNLIGAICLCCTIIVILLCLLAVSLRNGGVIFAPDVSDLPLRTSFAYLYLPTVIAVVFSIYIVWVDVDAKRFAPYRQLSKPAGALGKDSLLLHYPYDFLPVVPFFAMRKRQVAQSCVT